LEAVIQPGAGQNLAGSPFSEIMAGKQPRSDEKSRRTGRALPGFPVVSDAGVSKGTPGMQLPPYFLPQPAANWEADTIAAFEQLFTLTLAQGMGTAIEYTLPAPKWQFLCYLCDHKNILLHGSGNANIVEFEPRKSNDVVAFGNRRAVYAASDGLWAIYFAIVDRDNHVTSLVNSCFRVVDATEKSEPYYFFSINGDALPHSPWREGMIYLLPSASFEQQPCQRYRGAEIELAQWASPVPVRPLAKLSVRPEEFPFLAQIRPHDPTVIRERAFADPDAFPWLEA
jgi:hypothetical protein